MLPDNESVIATTQPTRQRVRWFRPMRCSICLRLIWSHRITLTEPTEAPEPRQQWVLCNPCHEALLVEIRRSTLRSATRLRIAVGLVAAERSPRAHKTPSGEQRQFQREFAWFAWALIVFTLLHVVILLIIWTVPR